jgi:hypothetical protein
MAYFPHTANWQRIVKALILNHNDNVSHYKCIILTLFNEHLWGHAVAQLVEALRYKPDGRGFDS